MFIRTFPSIYRKVTEWLSIDSTPCSLRNSCFMPLFWCYHAVRSRFFSLPTSALCNSPVEYLNVSRRYDRLLGFWYPHNKVDWITTNTDKLKKFGTDYRNRLWLIGYVKIHLLQQSEALLCRQPITSIWLPCRNNQDIGTFSKCALNLTVVSNRETTLVARLYINYVWKITLWNCMKIS